MPANVELYLIENDLEYASAINQYEDHLDDIINQYKSRIKIK